MAVSISVSCSGLARGIERLNGALVRANYRLVCEDSERSIRSCSSTHVLDSSIPEASSIIAELRAVDCLIVFPNRNWFCYVRSSAPRDGRGEASPNRNSTTRLSQHSLLSRLLVSPTHFHIYRLRHRHQILAVVIIGPRCKISLLACCLLIWRVQPQTTGLHGGSQRYHILGVGNTEKFFDRKLLQRNMERQHT